MNTNVVNRFDLDPKPAKQERRSMSRRRLTRRFEQLENRYVLASIAGNVFIDVNGDSVRDSDEIGIPGALITLSGFDENDVPVQQGVLTGNDGTYIFENLSAGTYRVTQTQPEALTDGAESTGVAGAVEGDDQLTNLVVAQDDVLTDNNFGETSLKPEYFSINWFFASSSLQPVVFREFVAVGEEQVGNSELASSIRAGDTTPPGNSNNGPTATDDSYSTVRNVDLTVDIAEGVLANDSDADGDLITVTVQNAPAQGSLTLESDGAFTYVPNTDFVGDDSFTYSVSDIFGESAIGTVSITVTDEPNQFVLTEGSPVGTSVGTLSAAGRLEDPVVFEFEAADKDANLNLRADDHIDGNPAAPVLLIEYLSFQCPACAAVHPTIEALQEEFEDDLVVVRRHLPLVSVFPNAIAAARASEAAARQGQFEEYAGLLFDNQNDWRGEDDPQPMFDDYAQQLGLDLTQFAADVADPAIADRVQRDTDAAAELGATATPTFFLNGEQLTPNPSDLNAFETLVQAELDADDADFLLDRLTGELVLEDATVVSVDASPIDLTVNATDLQGTTEPLSVSITIVEDTGATPVASNDSYDVDEDAVLTIDATAGILGNDSDSDGDSLTAEVATSTTNGVLSLSVDGSFTYSPNADFNGSDSFTYRANDGANDSAEATVSITVNAVNDAPTAADDSYTTDESSTLTVNVAQGVLDNDNDVEGDTLTASVVDTTNNGVLTLSSDGSFTYIPNSDFSGTDTFTYAVSDGALSAEANVSIVVNAVDATNTAPTANADSYSVNESTVQTSSTLSIDAAGGVLANDADAENDTLTAALVSNVANGTLTLNENGSFTYVPDVDFQGDDAFTYRANDGEFDSATTTVTITVTDINNTPFAVNDNYTIDVNQQLTIDVPGVLDNDNDDDGDSLTARVLASTANGTLNFNLNGSFTYTPNSNFSGNDAFTYVASDGQIDSNEGTVTINVVDNPPAVAANDVYQVQEDGSLDIDVINGVLTNDDAVDGEVITAVLVGSPSNGTLNLEGDGSFSYVPNPDFFGSDGFTYSANDGTSNSNPATVTITVAGVNDAPVSANDTYTVEEDNALIVNVAAGLLANDDDADPDTLTVSLIGDSTEGALTLNDDGSFEYVPQLNDVGVEEFTYVVSDGTATSAEATVAITITAVNDVPEAEDDNYSVDEDLLLVVNAALGVLANDSDVESNSLQVAVQSQPSHGILSFGTGGAFDYTPTANFSGVDSFTYVASDGQFNSGVATVTITVNPVNDRPNADDDRYVTGIDAELVVNVADGVLSNDDDRDDDSLTAQVTVQPQNGSLSLNDDGSFSYQPDGGFEGIDSFSYVANDGSVDSAAADVVITVNDPATAVDDIYSVDEDLLLVASAVTGLLDNDLNSDADSLTAVLASNPSNGTINLASDGSFDYLPDFNFVGQDSFTYVVNDGSQDSNVATVAITVNPVQDRPRAVGDNYAVVVNTPLSIDAANGVLLNDSDADGESISAVIETDPSNGSLTLQSDGSFIYTPDNGFEGEDSFEYVANDGVEDSLVATVTLNVQSAVLTAVDDSFSTNEDSDLVVSGALGLLVNDAGNSITPILVNDATDGVLTLASDGGFTYVPDSNFNGSDEFTYRLTDGVNNSGEATVSINVLAVNDPPVATPESFGIQEDAVLEVAAPGLLDNDTDIDGDSLEAIQAFGASNGTLVFDTDGSITYTPDLNFFGDDSFRYLVTDGLDISDEVTVAITVAPVNDPTLTVDDSYAVGQDGLLVSSRENGVLANDLDPEDDSLFVQTVLGPTNGTVQLNDDGSFTYVPDPGFSGNDSFAYTVNDGTVDSNPATVFVQVNPLIPGAATLGASRDNSLIGITAAEERSGGASDGIFVGQNGNGDPLRAVVHFDIASNVPAGATVTSVELSLNMEKSLTGATDIDAHRMLADWGESTSIGGGSGAGCRNRRRNMELCVFRHGRVDDSGRRFRNDRERDDDCRWNWRIRLVRFAHG